MSIIGLPAGVGTAPARMPAGFRLEPSRIDCLPAQRRLWVLERMDPGTAALHLVARWRLEGRVSVAHLDRALARLLARHAALRTAFVESDGEPLQVVAAAASCRARDIDLTGEPAARARVELERIARLEGSAPFDLAAPPLMRATLVRLGDDVCVLLVTVHRLVCDAASLGVLARDLAALCAAFHAGRDCDLPEAPGAASRDAASAGTVRRQLRDEAYWTRTLRLARHLELPPDRARPPALTFDGGRVALRLERDVGEALQDISRRAGCRLFTTALAALLTLLHRYSGETDIAVGSPVAGREAAGPDAVGAFADTLVLRADLAGDPAFTTLLERVRGAVTAAFRHRSTPFARLIELLQPARDLSRHALFSIHFSFQSPAIGTESGGAFCLVDEPGPPAGVLYDLDFQLVDTGDGWSLACEYNLALYDAATATGLLAHLANLLRAVAADPARKISRLPMLDAEQQRALAEGCNRTAAEYPASASVVKLFDGQAQRTPEAVAVVCGERRLSYRELDAASGRLATALRDRGIGPGSRVGLCVERSIDLVVALLAVLRAGAAYVPLDPAYPAARLAQIVGDAKLAAILTKAALRARLPATDAPLFLLDAPLPGSAGAHERAPAPMPGPDDVAYVIYTSGSTGRPKGVPVRHGALTNLLWSMASQPGLAAPDTLVAVTTVSFDIAALELLLPLIVGAKLVVAREEDCADGGALLHLLRAHRATVMQATPVTWQLLLASGWGGDPPLRMWCGGEALSRTLADRLLAHGLELWNLYGPTETTIWSSALRVGPGAGAVALGPPIANTQFHVLDAHGQLVPAGVAGELFIGGDGVAAGYLDLPALTHERFVPDPFRAPGARLYRTGDRVRRRPRGEFEFLGRADDQVKVRGFRIELGDIEAALRALPQVADAVALAGPDAAGETAIRAWVVARDARVAAAPFLDGVRTALRETLPGYMCPTSFVVLAALPRLPNGKVDRGALASRPLPPVEVAETLHAASPVERQLAGLWSEVLGIPAVGVDANFFEVGGHSLLAVRLLTRIEAAFGRKLSLAALFRHPTIAGQARLLERGETRAFDFRQVVALQPGGTRPPLIAINNTGIYYALSKHLGPDQPFTSLQLFDPALPPHALPRTLQEIAAGYAQLIRRVQGTGPYALLGWCVAGTLAFEVARQLRRSGQQVSRLILFDTLAPGRIERLPWLAGVLAGYSYRWQLIAADWQRARRGARPLADFLSNRIIVRKLLGALRRREPAEAAAPPARDAAMTPEQYDRWLLGYLEEAAAAYEPRPYPGPVTLFRSSQEPSGRFLDPQLGWGEFVKGNIEVVVIEGDHFSIFQEPAVSEMAQRIDSALRPDRP